MTAMTLTQPSGLDLKVERIRMDVKAVDLAARMGVSGGRIASIERSRTVTPEAVRRYREALATFATVATPAEAA